MALEVIIDRNVSVQSYGRTARHSLGSRSRSTDLDVFMQRSEHRLGRQFRGHGEAVADGGRLVDRVAGDGALRIEPLAGKNKLFGLTFAH